MFSYTKHLRDGEIFSARRYASAVYAVVVVVVDTRRGIVSKPLKVRSRKECGTIDVPETLVFDVKNFGEVPAGYPGLCFVMQLVPKSVRSLYVYVFTFLRATA